MIYLDTHCAIWVHNAEWHKFTPRGLALLEDEDLRLSPMVLLELDLLHEIKRLTKTAAAIAEKLEARAGIRVCDYPFPGIVQAAASLRWTRDPFDRILCAHAHSAGGRLLTKDATILAHFPRAVW